MWMNAIQSICKYKSIKILKTLFVIKKSTSSSRGHTKERIKLCCDLQLNRGKKSQQGVITVY